MEVEELTRERHEELVKAHRGGANLAPRDFDAVAEYEEKHRPALTLENPPSQDWAESLSRESQQFDE